MVGAGVVQVGSDSCRERMWRADENERYSTMNGYMGGGGRKEVEMWSNPPGSDRDLVAGRERQREECIVTGNSGRCKHAARGAGMSGGVCQVVGAGVVQVGSDSCRERMWRADENERYSTMNGYMG